MYHVTFEDFELQDLVLGRADSTDDARLLRGCCVLSRCVTRGSLAATRLEASCSRRCALLSVLEQRVGHRLLVRRAPSTTDPRCRSHASQITWMPAQPDGWLAHLDGRSSSERLLETTPDLAWMPTGARRPTV